MATKRTTDPDGKTTVANKNANGEGTIYQVKSGSLKGLYVAQLTIGLDQENRKPKRKSFYGKTRTEAKQKRDSYLEQHKLGLKSDDVRYLTFGEWLLQFMDLYKRTNLQLSTYERYMDDVDRHIVPALGDIYLIDLETDQIQALYNNLTDTGRKPATVHKVHQIIDQCLEQAVEKRYIPWNPDKATKRPKVRKANNQAMSEKNMDIFRAEIDKLADKWRAAFLVLLGTGLRIGELLSMEWGDVNLDEGTIFVRSTLSRTKGKGLDVHDPKTESSKASVPIPSIVLEALKRHKVNQATIALHQGKKFRVKADNNKLMQTIYEEYPRLESYPANPKKCKCPEDEATALYKTEKRKIFRCEQCGREWQRHYNNQAFPSDVGTLMSPRNFQRKFYGVLVKAKIEHINIHGLRHYETRFISAILSPPGSLRKGRISELSRRSSAMPTLRPQETSTAM